MRSRGKRKASLVGPGAPDKLLKLMLLLKVSTFGDA